MVATYRKVVSLVVEQNDLSSRGVQACIHNQNLFNNIIFIFALFFPINVLNFDAALLISSDAYWIYWIGREKSLNVLGSWLDEEKLITRKRRKGRCKRRIKFKKKKHSEVLQPAAFSESAFISLLLTGTLEIVLATLLTWCLGSKMHPWSFFQWKFMQRRIGQVGKDSEVAIWCWPENLACVSIQQYLACVSTQKSFQMRRRLLNWWLSLASYTMYNIHPVQRESAICWVRSNSLGFKLE